MKLKECPYSGKCLMEVEMYKCCFCIHNPNDPRTKDNHVLGIPFEGIDKMMEEDDKHGNSVEQ